MDVLTSFEVIPSFLQELLIVARRSSCFHKNTGMWVLFRNVPAKILLSTARANQ